LDFPGKLALLIEKDDEPPLAASLIK
jgi:hypothetical protein